MVTSLTLVIVAGIITAVMLAVLVYFSRVNVLYKLFALISFLLFFAFSYHHYDISIGAPLEMRPTGQHQYIYHYIRNDNIYLWSFSKERGVRVYKWPYSRQDVASIQESSEQNREYQSETYLDFSKSDNPEQINGFDNDSMQLIKPE